MPRWKQIFKCPSCRRRRWREEGSDNCLAEPPRIALLRTAARCSACGCRDVDVRQYLLMPRTADQTFVGGMVMDLVGFGDCARRDRQIREAIAAAVLKRPLEYEGWHHPRDPEFGWQGDAGGSAPYGCVEPIEVG